MRGVQSRNTCQSSLCPLSSRLAFASAPAVTHASPPSSSSTAPTASPYSYPPPIPLTALTPAERVIHVFVATTSNLINGFIFGGLFGFISGAWTKRSLRGAFAEARGNGKSWAAISAVYAGLQTASKVIRRKDDRYNAIVGACGSGAVFSAKNGSVAAAQGCVTFAALSYFLDSLTSTRQEDMSDEAILNKSR